MRAVDLGNVSSGRLAARWRRTSGREREDVLSGTRAYVLILGWIVFLGASVRLPVIMNSSFPANDGGLFMQAIEQLKANHFVLPTFLYYNGLKLPFAYPPVGFYVAAILSSLTHMSVLNTLRFVPLTFSVATIVAFIFLAQSFLKNRATVIAATIAFALVPHSHNWEIMGGGLTRSIGYFFAVLALWQMYLLFTERTRTHLLLTIVFAALVCMSHLEMALFVAVSGLVMTLFLGRSKRGILDAAFVAAGVLLMTSPWWGLVVKQHGLAPFLNAGDTSGRSVLVILSFLAEFNWSGESGFPIFGALSALGIVICLARRQYFLPAWVGLQLIADPRKFVTEAMVPLSLMVGICVVEFLIPSVQRLMESSPIFQRSSEGTKVGSVRPPNWLIPAALGFVIFYGWTASFLATDVEIVSLSTNEREAMAWVRDSTAPTSTFVMLSGNPWGHDRSGEWFPVLADRTSASTVQGYEWMPAGQFGARQLAYEQLQKCTTEAPTCIADWSSDENVSFDYLYIAKRGRGFSSSNIPCCSALVDALSHDSDYRLVYKNDDVSIFHLESPLTQADTSATTVNP